MPETKMSQYWTKEVLERCSPRELLVIIGAYGAAAVAQRMGYTDVEQFIGERQVK